MSTPTDAWLVMALILAGESPPPLPAIAGRVFKAPPSPDEDAFAQAFDLRHATHSTTDPKDTTP